MQAGDKLVEDRDIMIAVKEGYLVKATQDNVKVYGPGKITGFSADHISINGKRLLRSSNQFQVAE